MEISQVSNPLGGSGSADHADHFLADQIRREDHLDTVDDLVGRNVAALVKPPKGQLGGRAVPTGNTSGK